MINKITVTNYLGDSITMELRFPEKSGFLVQGVTGLNPPKATINTTDIAAYDGSAYNSAHITSRNIVFILGLLPNPTIEDTRHALYKYFPIKSHVTMVFETDIRTCETDGYVESNEIDLFSSQEMATISVLCPDSFFHSSGVDLSVFSNIEPLFEFPFSNESLTVPLIQMGDIQTKTTKSVVYTGDSSIGVVIDIHAIGPASGIRIVNTLTREYMDIDSTKLALIVGSDIIAGDDIIISTVKGDKYIHLQRGGVTYNILNALGKGYSWFQVVKGDNLFAYTATLGSLNLFFQIESQVLYEGV